ncbi:ABC transporter ATP-binding protein [Flavobacterium sp.]|uniref:ATP-binding cassette domain-containing protein n=1 Tax=Flavobacterium sp. TaxID=239 RepID=UPI002638EB81|nr:ABC transporter ATP-binding protein [Flavobacterium sp.]
MIHKIKTTTSKISAIIPREKHSRLLWFLLKNILFGILDLISIAYLIPIVMLLFDARTFESIATQFPFFKVLLSEIPLKVFALFFILFYFIKIIIQTKFNTALYVFLYELSTDLSIENTNSFINESFIQHQNINKGSVLQNVTNVPEDFSIRYLLSILNLITESIVLSILVSALLFLYFKITLMAILVLSFFALFIYFTKQKQMTIINSIYLKTQTKSNAALLNLLDGYLEIKNSGHYAFFLEKFRKEKALLNDVTGKLVSYNANYAKYLEIVLIVSVVGFVIFNFEDKNTVIIISVLGASSLRLIPSISRILNALTLMKSYRYAVDILSKNSNKTAIKAQHNTFESSIKLENIYFSYDENRILNDINLTIEKGSFIGVKGDSGVGKTTLLYLILGIIQPEKGSFYFDDLKMENTDFLSFASYVPQQPFLFNGTIIDNIVMGQNPAAIDYDYIAYLCQKLELDNVIKKMTNQYQTEITHESLRFSGGQKQRLALVRALYTRPSLLILDETTNQQDKELENKIFTFLKELNANQKLTIICVSHNPAIDAFFDSIYEIKN